MRVLVAVCLMASLGCVALPLPATKPIPEAIKGHPRAVTCVAFSHDGRVLVSGSEDGPVIVWDVESRQPVGPLVTDRKGLRSVALSGDGGRVAIGGKDGTVVLLDTHTWSEVGAALVGHRGRVSSLAFSPDGRNLASGGHDGTVVFWSLENQGSIEGRVRPEGGEVGRIAFSPDGRLFAAATSGAITFWDPVTFHPREPASVKTEGYVSDMAFSADGTLLARSGWAFLLWDVAGHRGLWDATYLYGRQGLAISPDNQTLALGSSAGVVELWDLHTKTQIRTLEGHSLSRMVAAGLTPYGVPGAASDKWRNIRAVAFSPDGRVLVSGADDGTLIFWDAATGQPLAPGRNQG